MTARVLIAGGSLGGVSAGLQLLDAGCDVHILERSKVPLQGRGAGIVLNPASVRYLTDRGIGDLDDFSVATRWLRYLAPDGGIAHEQPGPYRFTSYEALLRRLQGCLPAERYHLGHEVAAFEGRADGVTVTLADGRRMEADLLVCADGVRSTARAQLLPDVTPAYAGYVAWRGTADPGTLTEATLATFAEAITYEVLPRGHLLSYPIPDGAAPAGRRRTLTNWLWYTNVPEGPALDDLMTDREGVRRAVSLPPGAVQDRHVEALREAATRQLPPPLAEVLHRTQEPFIQAVFDIEVPRMAFGRICLIGDAAYAARPHAAAGTAKAAEDGYQLARVLGEADGDIDRALAAWEPRQLALARVVYDRTRDAGRRAQFDGTWKVGDPLPFGLYEVGDSFMPAE